MLWEELDLARPFFPVGSGDGGKPCNITATRGTGTSRPGRGRVGTAARLPRGCWILLASQVEHSAGVPAWLLATISSFSNVICKSMGTCRKESPCWDPRSADHIRQQ